MMDAWLAMGGYGGFVWPSFAVTVVVLGAAVLVTLVENRAARRRLEHLEREAEAGGFGRRPRSGGGEAA